MVFPYLRCIFIFFNVCFSETIVKWSENLNLEHVKFKRVGPSTVWTLKHKVQRSTDHQLALNYIRLYWHLTWIYLNYHGCIFSSLLFNTLPLLTWSSIENEFTGIISLTQPNYSIDCIHLQHITKICIYVEKPLAALKSLCLPLCLGLFKFILRFNSKQIMHLSESLELEHMGL